MIRFSNNVSTTLTTAVNSTQTQITVTDASKFPTLNEGDSTYCTLVDAFNAQWLEICEVTAISGNTLTVRRGIEGTAPRDFNVGAKCELRLTAELLTRAITEIQADRIDGNVTVIQLKRDDIDGLSPSPNANSFEVGELVYNTTTGDLWSKLDSGEITQLGGPNYIPDDAPYGGPQIYGRRNGEWTAIPFPSTFVSDVPPTILNPDDGSEVDMPTGSLWYDTGTTSELYVWDGMHWVSMTGVDSDSLEGALPDNVTTDDFQQQNIDTALVRIHPQSGKGYWRPVTTSDVNTEPDVTFRDEKGRFKSTKQYEDLTSQLKVNRFLALEIETQTETLEKEAEMRRTKDDQLQAEITALAEVVAGIDPDAENPDNANKEYVDEQVGKEAEMRREADSTLQSEIDALAQVVGEIDIPELGELPDDIATQEFVTEEVAKEAEVRRLQDVSLQSQINALAGLENNTDLEGFATTEYVDEKVASEAEIRGLQDDRIEAKVTNLAESVSDEIKAREQGDIDTEATAASYTDEQVGAESAARRTADEGLQKEVEALANVVAAIEIPEIPEVDLTGYATEDFVTETVGTESDTRRLADEGLQKEIDSLAEVVAGIDIPEVPEVDLTGYATEQFVTETVGTESDTRRLADEGLQSEIDTLAESLANIDFDAVVVQDDPPDIEEDGQLWLDSNRLELFISYNGGWISTTPLAARVEQGEAIQEQILLEIAHLMGETSALEGRIKIGEGKQQDIQSDVITLQNKVNALEGVVGQHRFDYTITNSNPRAGEMNGKNEAQTIVRPCDQIKFITLSDTDRDGKPVSLDKINVGDVLRFYGLEQLYAEYKILDGSNGFYNVELLSATLDQFNNMPYEAVLFSSFDPAGLATIDYVDAQDSELQTKVDGKMSKSGEQMLDAGEWKLRQPKSAGGSANFIVINDNNMNLYHVATPTQPEHGANMGYVDDKTAELLPLTGGTLTGQLVMQRTDGVSWWNYIKSEKPTAWDGNDSSKQQIHGLIIDIGTTNTYKQRFIIKGRSGKDLFEIHDEGDVGAVAEILGTLKAKDFLDEDGNSIIGAGAAPAAERPMLWKYNPNVSANNLGNGEFNLSSSPTNASADDWSIYFAKRDANGQYWHPHDSGREFTHEVDATMASIRGREQNCIHGKMNKWFFNQGTNNYARLRLSYYRSSNPLSGGKWYLMVIPGYFPHFTFSVDAQNNGTHS